MPPKRCCSEQVVSLALDNTFFSEGTHKVIVPKLDSLQLVGE